MNFQIYKNISKKLWENGGERLGLLVMSQVDHLPSHTTMGPVTMKLASDHKALSQHGHRKKLRPKLGLLLLMFS